MKKSNILMIIIIALVVSVCGYTIYRHFNYEIPDEIIPYSHYMDIIEDDNGYVVVGVNNYYKEDSKYNKDIILQGDFIKFDKNLNIVKKVKYDDDNNGFMSREIIKVDDGYIVTGMIMPLNRVKSVVLKLDKDLNVVKKIQKKNILAEQNKKKNNGLSREIDRDKINEFIKTIPFKLTNDQNTAVDEILYFAVISAMDFSPARYSSTHSVLNSLLYSVLPTPLSNVLIPCSAYL